MRGLTPCTYLSIVGTHARRLNNRVLKKEGRRGVMTLSLGIRFPLVLVIELAVCDAERRASCN